MRNQKIILPHSYAKAFQNILHSSNIRYLFWGTEVCYFILISSFFILDDNEKSQHFFEIFLIYLVFPAAILTHFLESLNTSDYYSDLGCKNCAKIQIRILDILRSKIFLFSIAYILSVSLITTIIPTPSILWLRISVYLSTCLIIFILTTVLIAIRSENFSCKFSFLTSTIAAFMAAYNLYLYANNVVLGKTNFDVNFLLFNRFYATYGIAPWHNESSTGYVYGLLLLFSLCSLFFCFERYIFRLIMVVNSAIFLIAIIMAGSRGAILAILASISISFILKMFIYTSKMRSFFIKINFLRYPLAILIILIASICIINWTYINTYIFYRDFGRIEVWESFIKLVKDRPLFGYGQRITLSVEVGDSIWLNNAHNIILSAQIYAGICGFLSMLGMLTASVFFACRVMMDKENPIALLSIIFMVTAGLVDYEVSVMNVNWQWFGFWVPVSLCIICEIDILRGAGLDR